MLREPADLTNMLHCSFMEEQVASYDDANWLERI